MTESKLKALVNEAIELDRQVADASDRLKEIKATLVAEAESRTEEHTETDGGGASWTAAGTDGAIARVTFPGPRLKSKIDGEGKAIEKIKATAGKVFDRLFRPSVSYKPTEDFRTQAAELLGRDAGKLLKLVVTESSPSVAFETKESAA